MSDYMTPQEAKTISLEVWQYMAKHPEFDSKTELPEELFEKIEHCHFQCPLCDLYYHFVNEKAKCDPKCPLNCFDDESPYSIWSNAADFEDEVGKRNGAQGIVEILQAWKPEVA